MVDKDQVLERIEALRGQNTSYLRDRMRIRQIMNGGAEGIAAIMAWDVGKGSSGKMDSLGSDLPAVNYMASGIERLAQKVGVPPSLKMPYGYRDSQTAREAGEKRERMVEGWDHMSAMSLQYPQIGRWLPGYGYYAWVIRPRRDPVTGQTWPHAELRDPYDTWPGYFGADQQPSEVCFVRSVPIPALAKEYPDIPWTYYLNARKAQKTPTNARRVGSTPEYAPDSSWEGNDGGTQIVEYQCADGSYIMAPEFELGLDYIPNPCDTGPLFVVAKRVSFDKLMGQYAHVIGLMSMSAKLNVLSLIAAEDSVFRETNIIGELEGNVYERGRFATNFFTQGTKIERPTGENNAQLFAQIDRLERQLRIGAAYDQGSDSLAARGGFITGQGQRELRDPIDANISEYQRVISTAMEQLDTRRLEYEEKTQRGRTKRIFWIQGDRMGEETYKPDKDIDGAWRSRRVYGMMAGWDESQKIVGGLQLLQGHLIDRITMQENLSGLDNIPQINQRIHAQRAQDGLFAALEQLASTGDPRAAMTLVEIQSKPDQTDKILKKFFTPQEPEMSPEEARMAGQPGQGLDINGMPPHVQTVLAELGGQGAVRGGAQTVAVNRG